jgi:hypothetical protein
MLLFLISFSKPEAQDKAEYNKTQTEKEMGIHVILLLLTSPISETHVFFYNGNFRNLRACPAEGMPARARQWQTGGLILTRGSPARRPISRCCVTPLTLQKTAHFSIGNLY